MDEDCQFHIQISWLSDRVEYVLPARFDDTEIPGLNPVVGYLDLKGISPKRFGEMILQKLGRA